MEGNTQGETLYALAKTAFHEGKVGDTDTFFQKPCKREQECTTGFGKGTTIPYVRHTCIKEAGILFVRMEHKTGWKSVDEKPAEAVIRLLVPDDRHDFHLKILSKLARRLMHEDFVDILKMAEKRQILSEIIDTVSWKKSVTPHGSFHMA